MRGVGCANTIPSGGRRHLIQFLFLLPLSSPLSEAVDFSGWNETKFSGKITGRWLGFPSFQRKEALRLMTVSQGIGSDDNTHTKKSLGRDPVEKNHPVPKSSYHSSQRLDFHKQPHAARQVTLPDRLLLHGHSQVSVKFIDVGFDQLLGEGLETDPSLRAGEARPSPDGFVLMFF